MDYDIEDIKAYIMQLWGESGNIAIRIFTCESGLNPSAYNPELAAKAKGITKHSSYGVAQLNRPYDEKLLDWKHNLDEAYALYLRRGFKPWTCAK